MGRRLVSLTLDNVDDLPLPCRACVFWELGDRLPDPSGKDDWISACLLEWGSCGRLAYVDGRMAGFALFAPPRYVAGAARLGGREASGDAALLMTVWVDTEFAAGGLGRVLVQTVVKDLVRRRGVRAVEAFGDLLGQEASCVVPVDFLTSVGFKTVAPHPRYPRLRIDLRTVATWRGEVEEALERWIGAMWPEKSRGARPVGAQLRSHRAPSTDDA